MSSHTQHTHKNTDCTPCLTRLVDDDPLPAAILIDGTITHANHQFAEVFHRRKAALYGRSADSILPGVGVGDMVAKALHTKSRQTLERQVKFEQEEWEAALWLRASPVGMAVGTVLLHVANRTAQLQMQISYLKDMRQSRSDTIWILDSSYRVAYVDFNPLLASIRHGLLEQAMHPQGSKILALLTKPSRSDFRFALLQAHFKPGHTVSVTLHLRQKIHKHRIVYADVVYLRDTFAGGHYYLCTRPNHIDNQDIIARLKIAYDVTTDAALARALGIDRSNITKAKRDMFPPSDWITRAFLERHYSMDWLMTGKPPIKYR